MAKIWEICQEITSKKNWYSKIFDPVILAKWRSELSPQDPVWVENFNLALGLLQTTAQGSLISEECDWEGRALCDECRRDIRKQAEEDPEEFGLNKEEVELDKEDLEDNFTEDCGHVKCKCTPPDSSLKDYIQYLPEGVLSSDLHRQAQTLIAQMAVQEPIDWHPGSNQQVRDLIHPSMYCYVKGVSKLMDGDVEPVCEEENRYQWLPSEFIIGPDLEVIINGYVNNLDSVKYPKIKFMLQEVFHQFLPPLQKILKRPLLNSQLQVIVKVGQILLTPENPNYPGGSWHIEGMPYEHIAATCIHYVDVKGITESFLEFRKPTIVNDEKCDYPQSDPGYTEHHYGLTDHFEGVMNRYLGLIRCHEGASVVFPNTLQHRVKEFSLAPGQSSCLRTILAFFVIDPDHRIVSTAAVPPQQGVFTLQEAQFYREQLMFHRKYFVKQFNEEIFERPFSLCEH